MQYTLKMNWLHNLDYYKVINYLYKITVPQYFIVVRSIMAHTTYDKMEDPVFSLAVVKFDRGTGVDELNFHGCSSSSLARRNLDSRLRHSRTNNRLVRTLRDGWFRIHGNASWVFVGSRRSLRYRMLYEAEDLVSRGWISACSTEREGTSRSNTPWYISSGYWPSIRLSSKYSVTGFYLNVTGNVLTIQPYRFLRPGRNDWMKHETYFSFFRLRQNFLLNAELNLLLAMSVEHWGSFA